jgi:hypothetical protein
MPLAPLRWLVIAAASLQLAAAPHAEDVVEPPHIRAETDDARALVAEAAARSPLIRDMLDRLERSDVIVYIRHRTFATGLEGRIGILAMAVGWRYLAIELACGRILTDQIATLGHELHHALEIADEPSIVDARSMAVFYRAFGMRVDGNTRDAFETAGAQRAGQRVRRELWQHVRVTDEK